MSQTIPDIPLNQEWKSLNSETGLPIGSSMVINNKSTSEVLLSEGDQPEASSTQGVVLTSYKDNKSTKETTTGSLEIWARIAGSLGTAKITVQGK